MSDEKHLKDWRNAFFWVLQRRQTEKCIYRHVESCIDKTWDSDEWDVRRNALFECDTCFAEVSYVWNIFSSLTSQVCSTMRFGSLGLTPSTHGCSLSGAVAELSHFGYSLWRLSGNVNALFVRDDMVKYLGGHVDEVRCYNEAWKYPRMVRYMDPILMDDWRKGSVENALKHAWSNFSCYHTLLNISYLPFSLSVWCKQIARPSECGSNDGSAMGKKWWQCNAKDSVDETRAARRWFKKPTVGWT